MNKQHETKKLKYLLQLPKNAVITFYRNPKEFSRFDIEKINPNHKLIIWGLLRKKYCCSKKVYKIQMGRVKIPILLLFYNLRDYAYMISDKLVGDTTLDLVCYVIFSLCFVYVFMLYPSMHHIYTHPLIHMLRG